MTLPTGQRGPDGDRTAQRILVTGAAGFIGSTLVDRLVAEGRTVVGIDAFEPFYPRAIKERNLESARRAENFTFSEVDTRDLDQLRAVVRDVGPDVVVDLAARAGVRDSLTNPWLYIDINVRGLQNVLTVAGEAGAQYVFASSSSVYGSSTPTPFKEDEMRGIPESPYGATKVAGEALVHAHRALTGREARIARLFTVYGPRQRPDLAVHKFARAIVAGDPIPVYANGLGLRDYTFVDDTVDGLVRLIDHRADGLTVNLGSHRPHTTLDMIGALSAALGIEANLKLLPPQPGDVPATYAAIDRAAAVLGWAPTTTLDEGLATFCSWFKGREGRLDEDSGSSRLATERR
jgi:UDP-glucuronate 4-epimerase